jgi:hypothetical protein
VGPALFLLATGRWRALAGFAAGGALLGAASLALVGPQTALVDYPRALLQSVGWRSEYGIDRPHMFGWSGLLSLLLGDHAPGLERALAVAASLVTLPVAVYVWRRLDKEGDAPGVALAVASATVLLSAHIHLQDLQIMLLPAALLVARRRERFDVLVPAALFVLAPLSLTGANLVTPLLAGSLAYQLRPALAGVSLRWRLGRATAARLRRGVLAPAWQAARRLPLSRRATAPRTMATTPTR